MLALVDYGSGNIRSVERALDFVGADYKLTDDPAAIAKASGLVVPGVGAAEDTMRGITDRQLGSPIRDHVNAGRPFLGICMGLHAVLDHSEENDGIECLGLFPGSVRKFPPGLHVPHMGWNQVRQVAPCAILDGIPDGSNFYFVHSYFADAADESFCAGVTDYGVEFMSVLGQDVVFATQFHPEKSGPFGLAIYGNFARLCEPDQSARGR